MIQSNSGIESLNLFIHHIVESQTGRGVSGSFALVLLHAFLWMLACENSVWQRITNTNFDRLLNATVLSAQCNGSTRKTGAQNAGPNSLVKSREK